MSISFKKKFSTVKKKKRSLAKSSIARKISLVAKEKSNERGQIWIKSTSR